jgi:hypothetical protein
MIVSAIFEIDPGTGYGDPGVAQNAAPAATITCRVASVSGVSRIEWEIFGTHGRDLPTDPPIPVPTITYGGTPIGQTMSFTVAGGTGQAYGIACRVNRGLATDDRRTSAVYVLDDAGQRPFFVGEELEADELYGVVPRLNSQVPIVTTSVPVAKTIYVDWKYGNGASPENQGRPHQTIADAIAEAVTLSPADDNRIAVVVQPGEYIEPQLTIPAYVELRSAFGRDVTKIIAQTATAPLINMSADAVIRGLTLEGANDTGGIGIYDAAAGRCTVQDVLVQDCTTCIMSTGADVSMLIDDTICRRPSAGTKLDVGLLATGGSEMLLRRVGVEGTLAGLAGIAFFPDGGAIFGENLAGFLVSTGFKNDNSGLVSVRGAFINGCVNAVHVPASAGPNSIVGISLLTVSNATNWDVLNESTGRIYIADSVLDETKISTVGLIQGTRHNRNPVGAIGMVCEGPFSVGSSNANAPAAFGGGGPHLADMRVFTAPTPGGSFTEITDELASTTGSVVDLFEGTGIGNTVYIGDIHDFPGIFADITIPYDQSGAIVSEYWNGGAWEAVPWMTHKAVAPWSTYGNQLFNVAGPMHMNLGPRPGAASTDLGGALPDLYYLRMRITSAITTIPQAERMRIHTDSLVVNEDGTQLYFGKARPIRTLPISYNTFEGAGLAPNPQNIVYGTYGPLSAVLEVGHLYNSYPNNLTRKIGTEVQLPADLDTSNPLEFEIEWHGGTSTGNMTWEVFYTTHPPDEILAHAGPGPLTISLSSVTTAGPGTAFEGVVSTHSIPIPEVVADERRTLALMIQRRGAVDSYTDAAVVRSVRLRYTARSAGEPS